MKPAAGHRPARICCMTAAACCLVLSGLAGAWRYSEAGFHLHTSAAAEVRFAVIDLYIDPRGEPLAAYQLHFQATQGHVQLVGIEAGEHEAFHEPPYYDPRALQRERVILAAFNTTAPEGLPIEETRVATLHVMMQGDLEPAYALTLTLAMNHVGQMLDAEARYDIRKGNQ